MLDAPPSAAAQMDKAGSDKGRSDIGMGLRYRLLLPLARAVLFFSRLQISPSPTTASGISSVTSASPSHVEPS